MQIINILITLATFALIGLGGVQVGYTLGKQDRTRK
ncbi:unnamed protein product [Fructobacillus tropaeoli]|jgi:hypothetical protein|uniref:Uncharacterized protein n=1 Tax=Fructobacillus tropaeoli TaxID=709323 RepID=A0ABN9YST3_9LACO|nr:unnamed protein product [Fructobacillus tropaeoli]